VKKAVLQNGQNKKPYFITYDIMCKIKDSVKVCTSVLQIFSV
jgi:hypothetical protein